MQIASDFVAWCKQGYKILRRRLSCVCKESIIALRTLVLIKPLTIYHWQKFASELFAWKSKTFLLVIDFISRKINAAYLHNCSKAEHAILFLHSACKADQCSMTL